MWGAPYSLERVYRSIGPRKLLQFGDASTKRNFGDRVVDASDLGQCFRESLRSVDLHLGRRRDLLEPVDVESLKIVRLEPQRKSGKLGPWSLRPHLLPALHSILRNDILVQRSELLHQLTHTLKIRGVSIILTK